MKDASLLSSTVDRVLVRPAALEACRALGLTYADVGRILGVSKPAVVMWGNGAKAIGVEKRHALTALLAAVCELLDEHYRQSGDERKLRLMRNTVSGWVALAEEELADEPLEPDEAIRVARLAAEMLVRLRDGTVGR